MINILIVDDHQIILDGLSKLIDGTTEIAITGAVASGTEAIEQVEQARFDLVLLDINLPDINGFEVCRRIKTIRPELKVIALTMHDEAAYISKMSKMGVDGYLLKNTGQEELLSAIRTVVGGGSYYSAEVTQSLLAANRPKKATRTGMIQKLTRRETEILRLIVDELTTEEIAEKLFISPTTVISHRKSLLRKLNAKNTAGLVKNAYEFRLLDK